MSLVYWILAAATFCISEAQVNFPDEMNTEDNNNNNNNNNVDAIFLQQLNRIANNGIIPSAPIGPDQTFFNLLSNGRGVGQAPAPLINSNCHDNRPECSGWARNGQCSANIDFMAPHCKRSCGYCDNPDPNCDNNSDYCMAWSVRGECQANPDYMRENCKAACRACGSTSLPAGLRRDSGAPAPGFTVNISPPGLPSN